MMAAKESRYMSINVAEDIDLEDDSDTTLASDRFLGKNSAKRIIKYKTNSRLQIVLTWFRWTIVIVLQGFILILLLPTSGVLSKGWSMGDWSQSKTETGGDINGLYIPSELCSIEIFYEELLNFDLASHKYTLLTLEEEKYFPNMSSDANRMEIRHNWDMLMPRTCLRFLQILVMVAKKTFQLAAAAYRFQTTSNTR
jgi:hypothetical protein